VPVRAGTGVFNFLVMRTLYFFHILALSAIASACCKSDDPIMETNCLEQTSFASESVEDTTYNCCPDCLLDPEELYFAGQPYDYAYPCFNPNNSNQIAYYRYNTSTVEAGWEIWVQDLCTGEKRMLVNDANYGIDWSVKDWIVYTAIDQQIYIIKSNGDSLIKLTPRGDFNRYPKWDAKGERIAYQCEDKGITRFIIFNESDGTRDTVLDMDRSRIWGWLDETKLFYVYGYYNPDIQMSIYSTYIYDLSAQKKEIINTFDDDPSYFLSGNQFNKESGIVLSAYRAIGKLDIKTGKFKIIKTAYRQESFYNAVVSKDEKYILFDIRSRKLLGPCTYDNDYNLYIMDLNGKNQRRIKIE